jgi:hypothetical protein
MRSMSTSAPEESTCPPVTPRASGLSPARLAPRKAARTRRAGLRRADLARAAFVRRRGRRWRALALRVLEELVHSSARADETPIPLEGGFERALKHNAGRFMRAWLRQLAAAARIIRAMFKCPLQRAKTHAERCGLRPRSCSSPPARCCARNASALQAAPSAPHRGLPRKARSRAPLPRRQEQPPRQSRKAALVTGAADPMRSAVI